MIIHSDAYTLVKRTISVPSNNDEKVILKKCAPFNNCISEINNTEKVNANVIDVVIPMYNLIDFVDGYSKTFGSL